MAEEEAEAHQLGHEPDSHSSLDGPSASAASSAKAAERIAAHAGGVSPLQASEPDLQEEEDIDSVTSESRDSSTASDTLERMTESVSDNESASASSDASLDEDAMLARMVQSHMHTGSRTKQKMKPESSESGDEGSQCSARAADSNIQADGQSVHSQSIEEGHALQGQAAANASPQGGQSRKQDTSDSNSHSRLMKSSEQSSNPAGKGSEAGSPPRTQAGRAGKKNLPRRAGGGKRAALERGTTSTSQGAELSCQVCKKFFDTRNSLFKHIIEQGHAVPLAEQRA